MKQPIENVLLEHTVGFMSDADVILWAEGVLAAGADLASHPDLIELSSLPVGDRRRSEEAGVLLRRLAEDVIPGYSLSSSGAQAHARVRFREECVRLVAEEIRPHELCRLIQPLEELFSFPDWLGDFYDHCDWLEPETQPVDARHLYEYAREYLRSESGA